MDLRRVNPHAIAVPEVRVTAQFDEELYQQFKESIKAVGRITPPICYEVKEELVLCDGLHRLDEAKANGETEIDVVVIPGDMVDVLTKNIFLDHLRGKTSPSEMVKVIKVLSQDYNLDSDQIKERTGLTRDYIEKLQVIAAASPSVVEMLDQGIIGVGAAFEIARIPYPLIQDEIIAKQAVYRFTVKELHDQVDKILVEIEPLKHPQPPVEPTEPPAPRQYLCEGCKVETEPKYLRAVFLCPNCFGDVWRLGKAREAAKEEVGEEIPTP